MTKLNAEIYWASLDPHVAALRYLSLEERGSLSMQLASQGYTIDKACQVDQEMLPEDVMQVRINNGFTWVPAADQPNIPTMPGCDIPGLPPYNPNKPYPEGSIVVSVDAADYPPFNGIPPVTPTTKPQVGEGFMTSQGMVFVPGPGLNQNLAAEGNIITQDGVEYVCHVDNSRPHPIWFTLK